MSYFIVSVDCLHYFLFTDIYDGCYLTFFRQNYLHFLVNLEISICTLHGLFVLFYFEQAFLKRSIETVKWPRITRSRFKTVNKFEALGYVSKTPHQIRNVSELFAQDRRGMWMRAGLDLNWLHIRQVERVTVSSYWIALFLLPVFFWTFVLSTDWNTCPLPFTNRRAVALLWAWLSLCCAVCSRLYNGFFALHRFVCAASNNSAKSCAFQFAAIHSWISVCFDS